MPSLDLVVAGKLKPSLVKFRDAVMDRDQRAGGFREMAVEIGETFAKFARELFRFLCQLTIRGRSLGRLRGGKLLSRSLEGHVKALKLTSPHSKRRVYFLPPLGSGLL
jgi:hypothetical protein